MPENLGRRETSTKPLGRSTRGHSHKAKTVWEALCYGWADTRYGTARARRQVAQHAYRYLLEQLEEVPSIRELCDVTGASYATLERGFRETYGMAPQAHLKTLRLSRARRELRQPNNGTSVTAVALHWGFLELGRFSVEYHKKFGESPSETLRKARGDSTMLESRCSQVEHL